MEKKAQPTATEVALRDRESSVRAREISAAERERAADTRDEMLAAREEVAALRDEALQARAEADEVRADRERLLRQMRDANEQLVVATVRAETLAREAEAARAVAADSEERFRTLVTTSTAIVWHADAEGHIRVEPEGFRAFTGTDAGPPGHEDAWIQAVHPDDRDRLRTLWTRATASASPYSCEYRLRKHDGSYAHVVARAEPMLRSGTVREWIGTVTDVTDRVRLDEARDQFIAILSHDLRNPLSAILTGAGLLKPLTEPYAHVVVRIAKAAQRMEAMIRDVMDFARGRLGGGIPAMVQACDLGAICRDVVAEMAQAYVGRVIRCDASGDLGGDWDPDRVEQVVSNLIGNAIAHGEDPITVTVRDEGDEVVLTVHNIGEPIPIPVIATLFEPFTSAMRPSATNHQGSQGLGLGLYIVREIVRAHGGTIALSSTRTDGTTFTIRWPRNPSARERIGARVTGP